MPVYRIVRRAHSVEVVDAYGRCVETVLDPGQWVGAPEPQLEATETYLAELIEQGERSGRYQPRRVETQRTYDSSTGEWSSQLWPAQDE